jgi:hypothetical protein
VDAAAPKKTAAAGREENSVTEADSTDDPSHPKAVFLDHPDLKDPFFPHSARRQAENATDGVAAQNAAVLNDLSVKAIIGINDPRAWINSRSFAAGEEGEVRLPSGGKIKIKCLEINPDSVSVQVEGITGVQVLPLRLRR